MRGLIFDPFAGVSGDMILGALVDAGLDPDWLTSFVASLGLGAVGVDVGRVARCGIDCARVRFELPREHAHRHLADVLEVVERSAAPSEVKETASQAFRILAEAEAAIHGIAVERVHFHEVGALDAILDVLCAVAGVAEMGIDRCYARPIAVGTGTILIEHGEFPVPAPATLRLLRGLRVRETGYGGECTTPTGVAILRALGAGEPPDEFTVLDSGYGAGSRDPLDRPNCLRVLRVDRAGRGDGDDRLFLVQADLDDMTPEYLPPARDALRAAGALDVVSMAVGMKKGRPGLRIEALVREHDRDAVVSALFRTTTTIGARFWPVLRSSLPREEETVVWRGQRIRRKRVRLADGTERVKPEFDDVVDAAAALGMPAYEVRRALEGFTTESDDDENG